jgi:hypothetical protein
MPNTNADNQRARRSREKEWLKEHGFSSWEKLHTLLMKDGIHVLVDGEVVRVDNIKLQKEKDFYFQDWLINRYRSHDCDSPILTLDIDNP